MENEEIFAEMFSAGAEDLSDADYQLQLMERLDSIIENQADIFARLNVVIEGQSAISNALYSILGLSILVIGFKIIWTVIAKWLFGGV